MSVLKRMSEWINKNGRPLDKAIINNVFYDGDKAAVVNALKAYQNDDGGFAHGLEPDFQTPISNPIDTWTAINYIVLLDLIDPILISSVLDYLKHTNHKKDSLYFISIPEINDAPHAPWWHFNEEEAIAGYNPSATLYAFILRFEDKQSDFYSETLESALKMVRHVVTKDSIEMHELRNLLEFYNRCHPVLDLEMFRVFLLDVLDKTIEKDAAKWYSTYCLKPLDLFFNQNDLGFDRYEALLRENLERALKQRNDEGIFDLTWSWKDYDPSGFKIAEKAWKSIVACEYLLKANHFNKSLLKAD